MPPSKALSKVLTGQRTSTRQNRKLEIEDGSSNVGKDPQGCPSNDNQASKRWGIKSWHSCSWQGTSWLISETLTISARFQETLQRYLCRTYTDRFLCTHSRTTLRTSLPHAIGTLETEAFFGYRRQRWSRGWATWQVAWRCLFCTSILWTDSEVQSWKCISALFSRLSDFDSAPYL